MSEEWEKIKAIMKTELEKTYSQTTVRLYTEHEKCGQSS